MLWSVRLFWLQWSWGWGDLGVTGPGRSRTPRRHSGKSCYLKTKYYAWGRFRVPSPILFSLPLAFGVMWERLLAGAGRGRRNVKRDGEENASYPPKQEVWSLARTRSGPAALFPRARWPSLSSGVGNGVCNLQLFRLSRSSLLSKCKNYFGKIEI